MSEIIDNKDNTFNSEEELIEYFQKSLAQQREEYKDSHFEYAPNSALTLQIGNQKNPETIDFEFHFKNILKGLNITKKDENNNLTCPYAIDFDLIIFS